MSRQEPVVGFVFVLERYSFIIVRSINIIIYLNCFNRGSSKKYVDLVIWLPFNYKKSVYEIRTNNGDLLHKKTWPVCVSFGLRWQCILVKYVAIMHQFPYQIALLLNSLYLLSDDSVLVRKSCRYGRMSFTNCVLGILYYCLTWGTNPRFRLVLHLGDSQTIFVLISATLDGSQFPVVAVLPMCEWNTTILSLWN